MKVFIVLCLAVASTCALNLRGSKSVDISPAMPFFEPDARIANGLKAKSKQFPYQVGLSIRVNILETFWCGGSLIASNWVLTAAHCTDGNEIITVFLGSIMQASGTNFYATEIIVHPQWDKKDKKNDIALLRIPAVSLSKRINIIPLPAISETYSNYANESVIVSGWGKTSDSGGTSDTLQYAILTIVDNSVCSNAYGDSLVKPSNICVSTAEGTSTCKGDSGGPLVLEKDGILVGLTSFGSSAGCTKGFPVAFTRVTSYRTWINDITGV